MKGAIQVNKKTFNTIEETIYSKVLPNGLHVFLHPKKDVSKVYSVFTTNYGSIDRTFVPLNEENETTVPDGIAHFLEHKLFEKEDHDVMEIFSKQGASPNAYTSFTKTAYLFSTTDLATKNVETLLNFVQKPYFSDASVEKEKGIIIQELNMYEDQPDWRSFMGTIKNMFHHHPVNIDILGTEQSINSITKEDLYTCYHTFYHPQNMAIFVTGNFDIEEMAKLIESNQTIKTFSEIEPIEKGIYKEPAHVATKESTINLPVSIPKVTIGIKDPVKILLGEALLKREIFQTMLLDYYFSPSGEFYETLYDEELIDGSFEYSTTVEENFGFSLISSNTENPDRFAERVKQLLLQTKDETITQETFDTMKKKQIGSILRSMNSLEYIANQYIHYHFAQVNFFDITAFIEQLQVEDLNEFLISWIEEERLTVCRIENKN